MVKGLRGLAGLCLLLGALALPSTSSALTGHILGSIYTTTASVFAYNGSSTISEYTDAGSFSPSGEAGEPRQALGGRRPVRVAVA